jgi:hypothetical protein
MTTIGNESRPAYVYDAETDTWVPIGVGPHTHDEYIDKTIITAQGDIIVGTALDTVAKLGVGTTGQVLVVDSTTATGLAWADKQDPITGAATTITTTDLTASRALASDITGKVAVSSVTVTELGYVSGVTSAIQTQLNGKSPTASPTFTGTVTAPVVRLTSTTDASLTSTGHAIQVGSTTGTNLIIDGNEILARNNGGTATLYLNFDGGIVQIGASSSTIILPGRMDATHYPWAVSAGTSTMTGNANAFQSIAVTFPSGRFAEIPRVTATCRSSNLLMATALSISTTGFTMNLRHTNDAAWSTTHGADWIAMQMTSTSADG